MAGLIYYVPGGQETPDEPLSGWYVGCEAGDQHIISGPYRSRNAARCALDEIDERDPDRLREDRDERRRLDREYGEDE